MTRIGTAAVCISLAVGVATLGSGCTVQTKLQAIGDHISSTHTLDPRAVNLCDGWINDDWGKPRYVLVGAMDYTLRRLRGDLSAAGVRDTQDTLLSSDRQGYVAICLSHPPGQPDARLLTYRLPDGTAAALGSWTVPSHDRRPKQR